MNNSPLSSALIRAVAGAVLITIGLVAAPTIYQELHSEQARQAVATEDRPVVDEYARCVSRVFSTTSECLVQTIAAMEVRMPEVPRAKVASVLKSHVDNLARHEMSVAETAVSRGGTILGVLLIAWGVFLVTVGMPADVRRGPGPT